jgi:hypothetical protein
MELVGVKLVALTRLVLSVRDGDGTAKVRIMPGDEFELEAGDIEAGLRPSHWLRAGLIRLSDAPKDAPIASPEPAGDSDASYGAWGDVAPKAGPPEDGGPQDESREDS